MQGQLQFSWKIATQVQHIIPFYSGNLSHVIRFPIDRFFAEKNRAKDLEKVRRDRNLGVVVALGPNGEAAIKGISVEGELIYNEPLW